MVIIQLQVILLKLRNLRTGSIAEYTFNSGSAIHNEGVIGDIEADFLSNTSTTSLTPTLKVVVYRGGAIYNSGYINSISGKFSNSQGTGYTYLFGSGIYNEGEIKTITADFVDGNSR